MRKFIIFFAALYCALPLHTVLQAGNYANPDMDELRLELDDLKHALHSTQVDLSLLDERLKKQNTAIAGVKGQSVGKEASSLSLLSTTVSNLEKKVAQLEKTLDKAAGDLRTLSNSISQTLSKVNTLETHLSHHDKRLDEVAKLKGTLTSISQAIGQRPSSEPSSAAVKSYCVKAGDSLEKIARINKVPVETIRKMNNLSNDKIIIGQELRLPDDAS